MKVIEGMKLIKELQIKADDLRKKVSQYCANLDFETPMYKDQKAQVDQWIQAHTDIIQEILKLRSRVQRTNIATIVEMTIGDKRVAKTIAEWIHRRKDLANLDAAMWGALSDRGLKEQRVQSTVGGPVTEIKIRRYYDPVKRDEMVSLYKAEPGIIDRTLEVTNAVTDLLE